MKNGGHVTAPDGATKIVVFDALTFSGTAKAIVDATIAAMVESAADEGYEGGPWNAETVGPALTEIVVTVLRAMHAQRMRLGDWSPS